MLKKSTSHRDSEEGDLRGDDVQHLQTTRVVLSPTVCVKTSVPIMSVDHFIGMLTRMWTQSSHILTVTCAFSRTDLMDQEVQIQQCLLLPG